MGAAQSGVITHDEFKNYLYGTVLLMLAPQLDPQFRFDECSNIKEEDKHVLPLVSGNQHLTVEEMLVEYTQYYGSNNGKEEAIDKYVKDHILDSKEHVMGFIKGLVAQLQDRRHRAQQTRGEAPVQGGRQLQRHTSAPLQQAPEAPVRIVAPPAQQLQQQSQQQQQRIRGHNKLQRRLVALDQALDNEQAAYQQQQQLNQGYLPVNHNEQDIEEIYAEDTTQDGEYEGHTYSGEEQELSQTK